MKTLNLKTAKSTVNFSVGKLIAWSHCVFVSRRNDKGTVADKIALATLVKRLALN